MVQAGFGQLATHLLGLSEGVLDFLDQPFFLTGCDLIGGNFGWLRGFDNLE
jgi:hypothetical protein